MQLYCVRYPISQLLLDQLILLRSCCFVGYPVKQLLLDQIS
jgi:hypothetical protein